MFSLFNKAINIVRSFVAPKPAPKPAPRPAPKAPAKPAQTVFRSLPAQNFAPLQSQYKIATTWVNPRSSPAQQQAARNSINATNAQNQRIAAENARKQAEAARIAAQKAAYQQKFNAAVAHNKAAMAKLGIKAKAVTAQREAGLAEILKQQKATKTLSEFDKVKQEYQKNTERLLAQQEKSHSGSFLNRLTGGFLGEQGKREFANKELEKLYKNQTGRYDKKLNDFHKWQAKYKSQLEKSKFGSQAEYDEAVKLAQQESEYIKDLEYTRAASEGMEAALKKGASAEGRSPIAKVGGLFNKHIVNGAPGALLGGVWTHTLGTGNKNVPSVVTAPARLMNAGTNLFRKKGDEIVNKDGKVSKYDGNAWTTSFNQSNLNAKVKQQTFDNYAINKFKSMSAPGSFQKQTDAFKTGQPKKQSFDNKKFQEWKKKNESSLKKQWQDDAKRAQGAYSFANEWALDPISYSPGVALKGFGKTKVAERIGGAIKNSAAGRGFSAVKNSKPVSWATAEYKPYSKRKAEFIQAEVDDIKRKKPLISADVDYWQKNKHKIKAAEKLKTFQAAGKQLAELDDPTEGAFKRFMSKKDRTGALQELVRAGGDWSKVPKFERFTPAEKTRISKVADDIRKWQDKNRNLELKAGIDTPFRQNYIPQYRRNFSVKTLIDQKKQKGMSNEDWWFTKRQEDQIIQSRGQLTKSLAARQYYSQLARQDLPVLSKFRRGYDDIGENVRRIENVNKYVKRSKWEQAMRPVNATTAAWKTAVLKLRPAWTVNNVAWNVPASVLAGGAGALGESVKMLRPKNFRKAMDEVPSNVKADLTGELGARGYTGKNWLKKADSKLNAGYTNIENFSRVAAFNAAKKQGMSDAEALKRVNKYMFDYKIRNIERPLKAVLPFYGWNKGLTKAAVGMPFDRPMGAKTYNQIDTHQQKEFEREFESVVPELQEMGYTEEEIEKIKTEQAKYFKGRLKVNGKYYTTPFNAMSEKGLAGLGFNPYMSALGEASLSVDSFGRKVRGSEGSLGTRIGTKFPQWELGRKTKAALEVASGKSKPKRTWIGGAGSEGYGMTKERQGYDSSKSSYDRNLDPRAKLGDDFAAYFGKPRGMEFDKKELVLRKALSKTAEDYFKLDTKDMDFPTADAARKAIFKKYGVSEDKFYKGVLAKYDTDNTKKIKGMRESAQAANKKLFDEYGKQPVGTRNLWAVNKLRELNSAGYFDDNPFKKSFDWIKPEGVARADKQALVKKALASGDWTAYRQKYGITKSKKSIAYTEAKRTGNWKGYEKVYGRSAKAKARDYAVKTGDWTAYRRDYGVSEKSTPHKFDDKYFKSADTMQRYKDGKFWAGYAKATKSERKALLAANPEYNKRGAWTDEQWDVWKKENKVKLLKKARGVGSFSASYDKFLAENNSGASKFLTVRNRDPRVRVNYR